MGKLAAAIILAGVLIAGTLLWINAQNSREQKESLCLEIQGNYRQALYNDRDMTKILNAAARYEDEGCHDALGENVRSE